MLTDREKEILELASQGFTALDISYILGISERTVDVHLSHARQKLDAKNTAHLVYLAHKAGLISMVFVSLFGAMNIDMIRPSRLRTPAARIVRQSRGKREWEVLA